MKSSQEIGTLLISASTSVIGITEFVTRNENQQLFEIGSPLFYGIIGLGVGINILLLSAIGICIVFGHRRVCK